MEMWRIDIQTATAPVIIATGHFVRESLGTMATATAVSVVTIGNADMMTTILDPKATQKCVVGAESGRIPAVSSVSHVACASEKVARHLCRLDI